ncbi:MAG TPA: hypothetical protein VEM59_03780 [Acidimicrobiia bacterium]|nr:hypothetical protein [Acidimicrobiia bacterium]
MDPTRAGSIRKRRIAKTAAGISVAAVLAAGACAVDGTAFASASATKTSRSDPPPNPTAPKSARVDVKAPRFSNPTKVDNPLFPIGSLQSAVLLGNDAGQALKIETTLLPGTRTIDVNGKKVKTLISQFVSYLDGRIHEVAIDWYAQADDGAVWYFGEDVFNFKDGVVADTHGTWLAGKDGAPGMIMPGNPQVGQVYRPENIPGKVFEEVTVKTVSLSVDGPRGPVQGAMVGQENHLLDGFLEDKTFAPGYGEFRSGVGGNLEALTIAAPADTRPGPVPAELDTISRGATAIFDAAAAGDWATASATLDALQTAWATHRASGAVPPLLTVQMDHALTDLRGDAQFPALDARNTEGTRANAIAVGQAAVDLKLQYQPATDIDRARFELWTRRLVADSGAAQPDPGNVAGDVTALRRVWDRFGHAVDKSAASDIEAQLKTLEAAAKKDDVAKAAEGAKRLSDVLSRVQPSG